VVAGARPAVEEISSFIMTCTINNCGEGAMDVTTGASSDSQYHFVLQCPCGITLTGDSEDDIVEVAFNHLREKHEDLAQNYEREHILFMALRLPK
jgi:hypothetical protein